MKNTDNLNPNTTEPLLPPGPDVLIVDDDPHVAALLEEFLQEEGFEVRLECDGLSAMSLIERVQPTVVLADVMMPRMDGITLASEVRRRWSTIDVILMSASESPASISTPFIQKPFDLETVISTIFNCPNVDCQLFSNRI